jgi:peroxiredoxin
VLKTRQLQRWQIARIRFADTAIIGCLDKGLKRKLNTGLVLAFIVGLLVLFAHPDYRQGEPSLRGATPKDFSFSLDGKPTKLSDLHGKVVLVNFWATWCPPCRKEMPDLETLYERFGAKGFVVLGISDEETTKVEPFVRERKISFPVLLDPGRKVNEMFVVEGIPKSFVYDREGKLVAQSIDMRTQKQFLEMLGKAGLE